MLATSVHYNLLVGENLVRTMLIPRGNVRRVAVQEILKPVQHALGPFRHQKLSNDVEAKETTCIC